MQLIGAALCDHVQDVEKGKINLFGVFDQMLLPANAASLTTFWLYAGVSIDEADIKAAKSPVVLLELVNPDDSVTRLGEPDMGAPDVGPRTEADGVALKFVIGFNGVPLRGFGYYAVRLSVNGTKLGFFPFEVVEETK